MRRPVTGALALALTSLTVAAAAGAGGSNPHGTTGQNPVPTVQVTFAAEAPAVPPAGPKDGPRGGPAPNAGPRTPPARYETQTIELPGPCPPLLDNSRPRLLQDQVRRLPNGPWIATRTYCEGDPLPPPAPVIDLEDIAETASEIVTAEATPQRPSLVLEPDTGALVGQPTIMSVDDPGPPPSGSALNTLAQATVTVQLGEPTYTWTFGDGEGRPVGGARGARYRSGSAVPAEGSGDPYITHTYGSAGTVTVSVTASYPVTYSFSNDPRTFTLPAVPVTSSRELTVRAARSELVAG